MGKSSEIYLFEMGDPVKITDLARKMILLSGLTPEKDIQFIYTGLRPGEKLHEVLLGENENVLPTHHHKIKIAKTAEYDPEWINTCMDQLWASLTGSSPAQILSSLQAMIPDLNVNPEPKDSNSTAWPDHSHVI
jgi:FlaA1/EpsC-like NDP-sugar epimerase